MSVVCAAPDPSDGVAIRLADYLDCQARALGENGAIAVMGGPTMAALVPALLTIFVALIGYRLILGDPPTLRDGWGRVLRLGFVLALVTSWPAYQTLVFRVATEAPAELAAILLPAAGLSADRAEQRVQRAYDRIRMGSVIQPVVPPSPTPDGPLAAPAATQGRPPAPGTATALVVATIAVGASLRLAIGVLLAIGPLVALTILFDATSGLFSGWVRSLAGAALALLATTIITAAALVMIESELLRTDPSGAGEIAMAGDDQAVTTLVFAFALASALAVFVAMRVAGAFRLPILRASIVGDRHDGPRERVSIPDLRGRAPASAPPEPAAIASPRAGAVADALAAAVRRETATAVSAAAASAPARTAVIDTRSPPDDAARHAPIGVAGRRSSPRRSAIAARRDRRA